MTKTLRAVVDRIENGYAVVLLGDQGHHLDWPLDCLPDNTTEGAVLSLAIDIDSEAATSAQTEIESIIDRLKRRE